MRNFLTIAVLLLYGCSGDSPSRVDVPADTLAAQAEAPQRIYTLLSNTNCEQSKLSLQFDLAIHLARYSDTTTHYDSCALQVLVLDKRTRIPLDSISLTSLSYFGNTFSNCDSVKSFSTHFQTTGQIRDGYYGDLVVADLNFDNKDDIAVINEIGGSNGPTYNFYIQTATKQFVLDRFLTDSVAYFPAEINKSRKALTLYVFAGGNTAEQYIYTFNGVNQSWAQTKHKIIHVGDG